MELVKKMPASGAVPKWLLLTAVLLGLFAFFASASPTLASHTTHFSGIGYFAGPGECTDAVSHNGSNPDFALNMTGDLEGCLYVFVERAQCSPNGEYWERGTEIYVGSGNAGDDGTFTTTYIFQATYEDCNTFTGQISGGCRHPIVASSGTGDYEGVIGRFDMVDDVIAGNVHYTGYMQFR